MESVVAVLDAAALADGAGSALEDALDDDAGFEADDDEPLPPLPFPPPADAWDPEGARSSPRFAFDGHENGSCGVWNCTAGLRSPTAWPAPPRSMRRHAFASRISTHACVSLTIMRAGIPSERAVIMKLRREVTAMVQTEIKRGVKAGVFRDLDVKGATVALLRMVDVAPWYSEKGPMSPERLADVYVDLILHMLCADSVLEA